MSIPFNNLHPLHHALGGAIEKAIARVIERGWYILGPEVEAFESEFAAYHGLPHAVAVANGTDAIELALTAAGVGRGDEVITVAHTAVPTVCAIERAGARPVLVDIDARTYTMAVDQVEAAITPRTRALVPVHLYGHPADMPRLHAIAQKHGLLLIEDCAQAHGATVAGRKVGTWGHAAAFSFYPTKNLGAYGDGGGIVTADPQLAARLRSLRNYGQAQRYYHLQRGVNSRLDDIQAAILRVKLAHLDEHNGERRRLAGLYRAAVPNVMHPSDNSLPYPIDHVYHLYVVRHRRRDELRDRLKSAGVDTLIHYSVPVHRQQAYADLGYGPGSLPVTERVCAEILSLPLYVGLHPMAIGTVANCLQTPQSEAA